MDRLAVVMVVITRHHHLATMTIAVVAIRHDRTMDIVHRHLNTISTTSSTIAVVERHEAAVIKTGLTEAAVIVVAEEEEEGDTEID